jgi:hypothetical protein
MRIAAVDVDLISLPAVLRITTESGAVGEAYHEWSVTTKEEEE